MRVLLMLLCTLATLLLAVTAKPVVAGDAEPVQAKAATPVFEPAETAHILAVTVKISSQTQGAVIYYTTDGSTPDHKSLSMQSGATISWNELGATTFKAIAVAEGMADSEVAAKEYTVIDRCGKPTLDPPGGKFVRTVDVALDSSTAGATIYYTTDHSTPTADKGLKVPDNGRITIDKSGVVTVRAMATKSGMAQSLIAEAVFDIQPQAEAPEIQPSTDTFVLSATLTLTSATPNSTVYYTLDGTPPSRASLSVRTPATVAVTEIGDFILRAFASSRGYVDSEVASKRFVVLARAAAPAFDPPSSRDVKHIGSVEVTFQCDNPSAVVHYLIGTKTPDSNSPSVPCGGKVVVDGDGLVTVRAFAAAPGMADSAIQQAVYLIAPPEYDEYPVNNVNFSVNPEVEIKVVDKTFQRCKTCTPDRVGGRLIKLNNPLGHFSMMEPLRGCGKGLFLPSQTGRAFTAKQLIVNVTQPEEARELNKQYAAMAAQYKSLESGGCQVVSNAGFFNTSSTACYGHLVTQGSIVQTSPKHNVNFGIRGGKFVVGYLTEAEVRDPVNPFNELVSGVLWVVRDGRSYVVRSARDEDMSSQETGSNFITVKSARTIIGHDWEGRLMILQVEGETWVRGADLLDTAELAVELGFMNAINLDGGGSASVTRNQSLISTPTWHCDGNTKSLFRCEKPVSTVACIHAQPPPLFVYDGPEQEPTVSPTLAPTAAPTPLPTLTPTLSPTPVPAPIPVPTPQPVSPNQPTEGTSADNNSTADSLATANLQSQLNTYQLATATLGLCLLVSLAFNVYPCWKRAHQFGASDSMLDNRYEMTTVPPRQQMISAITNQHTSMYGVNARAANGEAEDDEEATRFVARSNDLEGFYSDDDEYFATDRRNQNRSNARATAAAAAAFENQTAWQQMPASSSIDRPARSSRWFQGRSQRHYQDLSAEEELNPFTRST